jgi:hypothetical protein
VAELQRSALVDTSARATSAAARATAVPAIASK